MKERVASSRAFPPPLIPAWTVDARSPRAASEHAAHARWSDAPSRIAERCGAPSSVILITWSAARSASSSEGSPGLLTVRLGWAAARPIAFSSREGPTRHPQARWMAAARGPAPRAIAPAFEFRRIRWSDASDEDGGRREESGSAEVLRAARAKLIDETCESYCSAGARAWEIQFVQKAHRMKRWPRSAAVPAMRNRRGEAPCKARAELPDACGSRRRHRGTSAPGTRSRRELLARSI